MVTPDGCGSNYWQLLKGLYELQQAGREWYLLLNNTYHVLGYSHCISEWSVYIRQTSSSLSSQPPVSTICYLPPTSNMNLT
jgi:hypothetical protein